MRGFDAALVTSALALAAIFAAGFVFSQEAFAATVTWDGETDSNWATATNWDGDVAPVTGDDVVLTNIGDEPANNDLVGVQLHSVTISSAPDPGEYILAAIQSSCRTAARLLSTFQISSMCISIAA